MIRKICYFVFSVLIISLLGCSAENEEEPTAEEAFLEYAAYWEAGNYEKMYELLSTQAKESFPKDEFLERNAKIYGDIRATDLTVTMFVEEIVEEEAPVDPEEPETEKIITYNKKMDTFAGEVSFRSEVLMTIEIEETEAGEEKYWRLNWAPAMIFDSLEVGDKVRLSTLDPTRGEIFDRKNIGLAVNGKVIEIGIVPERLPDDEQKTYLDVSNLLQLSVEDIEKKINQSWVKPTMFVPLKGIAREEVQLFEALMEIPGVLSREKDARVYPYKEAAVHLTGYLAEITEDELKKHKDKGYTANSLIGKSGLELIYEEKLRGEKGGKIWIETEAGVVKDVVVETLAVDGEDIYLTIDSKVQTALYRQLEGEFGTAVALHPLTGEVLSLVSSPTYDPNKIVLGMPLRDLLADAAKPLVNRFTHTFTPGSTIKPMIAAIALEDGWIANEKRTIDGHTWQKDSTWGNYSVRRVTDPNHDVDLADALIYSDNIYFAQMAIELGIDNLETGLREFGFEESLPFEYPMSSTSKIANNKIDSEMLLADTGYGQGQMLISPLHLALLYTTFVNEGSIPKPTLLKTDREPSYWKEALIEPENASYILEGLKDVIHHPRGTAAKAKIAHIPLAGKTGTTEHKEVQGEKGRETGWFVAMNTDNPELLVLLMVDNVENRGGSGLVVSKVRDVFLEVFLR